MFTMSMNTQMAPSRSIYSLVASAYPSEWVVLT